MRDNAKWIVAAFTGSGTILFSALSVANLSKVAEGQAWILPVALAAIPLLAAGWAVWRANLVLSAPTPALAELFPGFYALRSGMVGSPPSTSLIARINELLPTAVAVYGSLAAFDDRLVTAHKAVEEARSSMDRSRERRQGLEEAWTQLDQLQEGVQEILDCGRYVWTQERYQRALPHFLAAAVLALLGIIASGVVTGTEARDRVQDSQAAGRQRPRAIGFDGATPVQVYFQKKAMMKDADGPNDCRLWDGIYAWAVGGDYDRPLLLFAGYASDDPARGQLGKREIARCSTPWTWATTSGGGVILVPR